MNRTAVLILLTIIGPTFAQQQAKEADVFFEREIRPLLVEKCQSCHGEKARGGLRLSNRAALLKGGDGGAVVVVGKPDESRLIKAVLHQGEVKMPPTGKLSAGEIEKLKRWVAMGVPWPGSDATKATPGEKHRKWWAYQPVRPQPIPGVKDATWGRTPIDRFILAELQKRHLTPSPQADRRTLIRRATFDLTGLPPTPEEVEAFANDRSSDAFEQVVDRLLSSPSYGERWGRHWLDVVRYTDYHDGNPQARTASCEPLNAFRYRDWVVRALNADLGFDDFIVHQIAGDLLPIPAGEEFYADGLIATTFLTNGSWDRGDADKEKMVSDMVDDQIDTIGKAFMGLTLGCARCHDHKFDPVTTTDYYALAGIFYSTRILEDIGTKGGEYTLQRIPLVSKAYVAKRAAQIAQINEVNKQITALDKTNAKDPARAELIQKRDALSRELLPEPPVAEAAQDGGTPKGLFPKIQDVPVHVRGSYTRLGSIVPRRMPTFFAAKQAKIEKGSGRLELARWVASKDNPLTARVIVNRVWQWHFGSGLVTTANNFGVQSEPPSHPELLDWLASTFVEDGWSLKRLHRRIMLSAVYQQASAKTEIDDRWLARFPARRLEAEAIRDAMLSVTGRLDRTRGGPATADLATLRRSLYVQTARWDRSSYSSLFDAANPDASTETRTVSTIAPQALFLLNNDFALSQAQHLADRLGRETNADKARLDRAYRLLFARRPHAEEAAVLSALAGRHADGWRDVAHVLLCCNEFAYLD